MTDSAELINIVVTACAIKFGSGKPEQELTIQRECQAKIFKCVQKEAGDRYPDYHHYIKCLAQSP